MKQRLNIITLIFSLFFLGAATTPKSTAVSKIDYQADGIYIDDITVEELEQLYQLYGYKDYIYMRDWIYPPIFLTRLPSDFSQITDSQKRNKLFLQITGPLALKLSDELIAERIDIWEIDKQFKTAHDLSPQQEEYLERQAQKYDIFTRLKGERRYAFILKELMLRVNKVPPSLLMGVAAIESNWGTARPAAKGNSLYRELLWYSDEPGLIPADESEDKSYKYKIFPSLLESMRSYAHKLNSGVNYLQLRFLRAEIESRDKPVLGRALANAMIFDTNLRNFAGLLDYTITFYELTNFDEATLGDIDWLSEQFDKTGKTFPQNSVTED